MARRRALFLVGLVLLAGCLSVGAPDAGAEQRATVTRVVDGDTVDVRFADGGADTVRLLGVDAPEVGGGNDPGEFEGVPSTEAGRRCLASAADEATGFVETHIAGAPVRVVTDPRADRRGDYGRLLAYIETAQGTDLNRRLVETGHARVYDSTFSRADRYYAAEADAQSARRGLWACREPPSSLGTGAGPIELVRVHADAAGNDHENLDDEYVVFRNGGDATVELTGWTVVDGANHTYRFPDGFTLAPGERVTVYTGSGTDTAGALYWGAGEAVWNNDGDTVRLRTASGESVLRYAY